MSDGQLLWVIENGSGPCHLPARQGAQQVPRPGRRDSFAGMSSYRQALSGAEICQLRGMLAAGSGDRQNSSEPG